MSLKPQPRQGVPEETARIARQVYRKGNIYMAIHDELEGVFSDEDFVEMYAKDGKPGVMAWRLALVSVMQYMEGLSDSQTADAVRSRIDWKYVLELELTDSGFDSSVLCKFRRRLVKGKWVDVLLNKILDKLIEKDQLKAGSKQRTDATHIVAAVTELNRLGCVGEAMRIVLNDIAEVAPEWLSEWLPREWVDRYGERIHLSRLPKKEADRMVYALQVGQDGQHLLEKIDHGEPPVDVTDLPSLAILRQIWSQQYDMRQGELSWRSDKDLPSCHELIQTPHDSEARYGVKRNSDWTGYKAHFTETCDDDAPHFIVDVLTTPAPQADVDALVPICEALNAKGLLPDELYLDSGYLEADHLVDIPETYGIELVGQVREAPPALIDGQPRFTRDDFDIDWAAEQVTCPAQQTSRTWSYTTAARRGHKRQQVIKVQFDKHTCRACPKRAYCTTSQTKGRSLELLHEPQQTALDNARQRQHTAAFKERYKRRAGIEGTISQLKRIPDVAHAHYVGQDKTHLQNILAAGAINLIRWYASHRDRPLARTRVSRLKTLVA